MMRSTLPPLILLILTIGCGRSDSNAPSASSTQPATTQSTNAGGLGMPPNAPNVGIRPPRPEDVKPVVGQYGGRLVRDTLGEPKSFNPITVGETSTSEYTQRMFQGMLDIDPRTGLARPLIAEKWELGPDELTWTFHLRKDVTFNDGSPLTAHDVVFTINDLIYDNSRPAGAEPRWPCSARDSLTFDGKQCKVTAPDDYTVQIVTPVKCAILDELMSNPCICSKKKYEPMVKAGSFGGAMSSDAKPQDIVGSGPFMFGSYARGEAVTLKKNPNYWRKGPAGGKLPYLDELYFHISKEMNQHLLNFERGMTDVYMVRSGKDVARLKPKMDEQKFDLYQMGPDYGDLFLALNMNLESAKKGKIPEYKVNWFRDRRFREALSYAIDRQAQVRNIRVNLAYPEYAPHTLAPGPFRVDVEPIPHDPAKAKALLDKMGLKVGPNGIRQDAQGREVSFTLNTNSGNELREEACNFIRKDLEAIGVKVNILFLEFNLLVEKMDVSYDWEALVMALTGTPEPHWGANIWKSSGRLHLWWPNQKTPSFDWEKEIDNVFETGIQEMNKPKRREMYRKWVDIARREQPFIYLTVNERAAALRRRFGNIFPGYIGDTPIEALLQVEEEIFVLPGK